MAITVSSRYAEAWSPERQNERLNAIATKCILRGDTDFPGTVERVPSQLKIKVKPFKAIAFDGLLVVSDTDITLTVAAEQTYYVVLHAYYVSNNEPIAEVRLLTTAVYDSSPSQSEYVVIARVEVLAAATEVLAANIYVHDSNLADTLTRNPIRGMLSDLSMMPLNGNKVGDVYLVMNAQANSKDDAFQSSGLEGTNTPKFWVWAVEDSSLLPGSSGYGNCCWMPIDPHPNMIRVYNNSGSDIAQGKVAVMHSTLAVGTYTTTRYLPAIKLNQPLTDGSRTATFGRPVFVPFDIDDSEMGWVITEGIVPYSHAFTGGEPIYAAADGEIYGTDPTGELAPHYAGPLGWALIDNRIWFDPGRVANVSKNRYGDKVDLSLNDAALTGAGVSLSSLSTTHKTIIFPNAVAGTARWMIPVSEHWKSSGLNVHEGNYKFIRIRFSVVYVAADVGGLRFNVGVAIYQNGGTIGSPLAYHTGSYTLTTLGVAYSVQNVEILLGTGLFDGSGVPYWTALEDMLDVYISREGTDGADTALDSAHILAARIDFDMNPAYRLP